ncbi:protein of unknown function (plasmid) [Azospirillum lipoferum 4B]|uniref:Uncharacterized protein n=1 Tax=Azospirillum lipoferum (strain 4B) TaxID=862719 RepID=G7ZF36_AZOL4|nr:protein of unknown function [Azospirillum lipoferum 4B]
MMRLQRRPSGITMAGPPRPPLRATRRTGKGSTSAAGLGGPSDGSPAKEWTRIAPLLQARIQESMQYIDACMEIVQRIMVKPWAVTTVELVSPCGNWLRAE